MGRTKLQLGSSIDQCFYQVIDRKELHTIHDRCTYTCIYTYVLVNFYKLLLNHYDMKIGLFDSNDE